MLAWAEAVLVDARSIELADDGVGSLGSRFDSERLSAIHAWLFQDVYEWAGRLRTVGISKGFEQNFAPVELLSSELQRVERMVAESDEELGSEPRRTPFLTRLLAELNYVHPFREGNGRVQRLFVEQLAATHGVELDWTSVTKAENDIAFVASMRGDRAPLTGLVERVSRPF